MDDIEKIKKEKKEKMMEESDNEEIKREKRNFLTEDARGRLKNFKMAYPEIGEQIESELVEMYKAGRLNDKIDENDIKRILKKAKDETRTDFNIKTR